MKKKRAEVPVVKSVQHIDFKYSGVDYNYESGSHCEDYGCEREGICRCSTIDSTEVTTINFHEVVDKVCKFFGAKNEIEAYCVGRVLKIYGFDGKDKYTVNTCGGYYGEEIDNIKFNGEITAVDNAIYKVCQPTSDREKIEFVLELEYGYVLESLKNKDWFVVNVETNFVQPPNTEYYNKKLNNSVVELYRDYEGISCVALGKQSYYSICDGYHRYTAAKRNGKKIIKVLLAS